MDVTVENLLNDGDNVHVTHVWQITLANITGPDVDEFLLKVQQATAAYALWYTESPNMVCFWCVFL